MCGQPSGSGGEEHAGHAASLQRPGHTERKHRARSVYRPPVTLCMCVWGGGGERVGMGGMGEA